MAESIAFYRRLGFEMVGDYGHYFLLADGREWHLHLNHTPGWPVAAEDNPMGLCLYVADVDAVAERLCDAIIEPQGPHLRACGTYEYAVSDPSDPLVRIGRAV